MLLINIFQNKPRVTPCILHLTVYLCNRQKFYLSGFIWLFYLSSILLGSGILPAGLGCKWACGAEIILPPTYSKNPQVEN